MLFGSGEGGLPLFGKGFIAAGLQAKMMVVTLADMPGQKQSNILYFLVILFLWALAGRMWFHHAVFVHDVSVRFPVDAAQAVPVNMPFTLKSGRISTDFSVDATISHYAGQSGRIRFAPDDCFLSVALNGKDITPLFNKEKCWPGVQLVDLSGELRKGENRLNVLLHDKDIDYGLRIFGVPSVPEIGVMAGLLALSFYLLSGMPVQRLVGYFSRLPPYWQVSLVPLMGFAIMSFAEWPRFGFGLSALRAQMVPVYIALLLWLRHVEYFKKHSLTPNRLMFALALTGFIMGSVLFAKQMQWLRLWFIWGGLLCSFFIFLRPHRIWGMVREQKRFAATCIAGGLTGVGYDYLQETIWGWMVYSTAILLRTFFLAIGIDATVTGSSTERAFLQTSYFQVYIHQPCSGLEGIFLFFFLLSLLVLLDWKVFGRFRIWPLYVFGYVYMYVMNAIRIGALFMIGYHAGNPASPAWVRSLKGTPFEVFHTYTGWVIYLLAFFIFAAWMYRHARKLLQDDACGRVYE